MCFVQPLPTATIRQQCTRLQDSQAPTHATPAPKPNPQHPHTHTAPLPYLLLPLPLSLQQRARRLTLLLRGGDLPAQAPQLGPRRVGSFLVRLQLPGGFLLVELQLGAPLEGGGALLGEGLAGALRGGCGFLFGWWVGGWGGWLVGRLVGC